MKKLIALLAVTLPLVGQAEPPEGQDWWACQSVAAGGLIWEKPSWRATRFNHDFRFILIGVNNTITEASAAKAMDSPDVKSFPNNLIQRHLIMKPKRSPCRFPVMRPLQ